jgi:4-hydroxybenzoate polyprenyltransferase
MQADCEAPPVTDVSNLGCAALGSPPRKREPTRRRTLAGILWLVLVVLIVLWLIGLVANIGGGLIHVLLVVAVIVLLYNLLMSRRTAP